MISSKPSPLTSPAALTELPDRSPAVSPSRRKPVVPSSVLRPSVASSLVILPLPRASLMVAPPDALLKLTEKVSAVSNALSLDIDTAIDLDVSPAAKESVPEPAVKSVPEVAVPLLVAKSTVEAPVVIPLRVTVNVAVPADSLTVASSMEKIGTPGWESVAVAVVASPKTNPSEMKLLGPSSKKKNPSSGPEISGPKISGPKKFSSAKENSS